MAGFLFVALPKESTSPALYQSLTDAGPLPGGQGHAALSEGFPDIGYLCPPTAGWKERPSAGGGK